MKQLSAALLLLFITASCKPKQQQFITTLRIEDSAFTSGQLDTAVLVVQKRLVSAGYKEAVVMANPKMRQLIVQSPALDKDWLKNHLLKKGSLILYECYSLNDMAGSLNMADKLLAEKIDHRDNDTTAGPFLRSFNSFAQPYNNGYTEQYPGYTGTVQKEIIPQLKNYVSLVKDVFPADMLMLLREQDDQSGVNKIYEVYFLKNNSTKLAVSNLVTSAEASPGEKYVSVKMTFSAYGAKLWERMTTRNVNKSIAIVIDNIVLSAPTVIGPIAGGQREISGSFSMKEASEYASLLRSGDLPLQLQFAGSRQAATGK